MICLNQFLGFLDTFSSYLLNKGSDFLELGLLVIDFHQTIQVSQQMGILLSHTELDDMLYNLHGSHQAHELLAVDADSFQIGKHELRQFLMSFAILIWRVEQTLKEEPDAVAEENARFGRYLDQTHKFMGLVNFSVEIDTTQLRNIKLEVASDPRVEIWINSAFL